MCVSGHQGEVVDVQYGGVDDLRRAKDTVNLTNQIAVVKLGQAPLLYKVGGGQTPPRDTDSTYRNRLRPQKPTPPTCSSKIHFSDIHEYKLIKVAV